MRNDERTDNDPGADGGDNPNPSTIPATPTEQPPRTRRRRRRLTGLDALYTDTANGERFADEWEGTLLYDWKRDTWYIYDGRRWAEDVRGEVYELAKQTARAVQEEAALIPDTDLREAALQAATKLMSVEGQHKMLRSARSIASMRIISEEWDAAPNLFNMMDGTFNLETMTLQPHDPADRITLLSSAHYDPDADCPLFKENMATYWQHAPDIIDYVIVLLGMCLSGLNKEKCFMILHGPGDTGKTSFIEAVAHAWGGYCQTTDISTFFERKQEGSAHSTDLVKLVGARIVRASEPPDGVRLSDTLIKKITGRAPLTVRELRCKPFDYFPTYKIWFDTNHLPRFSGSDQAMWNRIRTITFTRVFSFEEQQEAQRKYGDMTEALKREADGIIALALRGWTHYKAHGMPKPPQSVETATQEYRYTEDVLGQFIDEWCLTGTQEQVDAKSLYEAFREWGEENGYKYLPPQNRFGTQLAERGFQATRTKSQRLWHGLRLRFTKAERLERGGGTDPF